VYFFFFIHPTRFKNWDKDNTIQSCKKTNQSNSPMSPWLFPQNARESKLWSVFKMAPSRELDAMTEQRKIENVKCHCTIKKNRESGPTIFIVEKLLKSQLISWGDHIKTIHSR